MNNKMTSFSMPPWLDAKIEERFKSWPEVMKVTLVRSAINELLSLSDDEIRAAFVRMQTEHAEAQYAVRK